MELAIVATFLAYIGWREWTNNARFKDLELKLLAKTPAEYATYKAIDKVAKPNKPKVEDDLVDPFEVEPEDALRGMVKE